MSEFKILSDAIVHAKVLRAVWLELKEHDEVLKVDQHIAALEQMLKGY